MGSEPREPIPPIQGVWRASGDGRGKPCRLAIGEDGVTRAEADDAVLASAPFEALVISSRVGSIPRHVGFPDGSDFETADNDAVDEWQRRRGGRHAGMVHDLERFRPRLIAFTLLAVALCYGLYRFAVPVLVEVAIAVTPPVVTKLMSQSVMASLDGTLLDKSGLSDARQKELSRQFGELAALTARKAPAGEEAYTLNFRKGGSVGPNAFALPDGTLVLTDELVELAKDDEMVLGVLAHEIGHVDHEHSLRQLYRAAGVTALIMLIGGDIGSGTEDILVQGSALLALSYSRGAEREADRFSVELMHRAGRDPAAIARFFELLRDRLGDNSEGDFLSTHPATPERIAETRRYAEEITAGSK